MVQTISVNVRLCGGIPRDEIKHVLPMCSSLENSASNKCTSWMEPVDKKRITTINALDGLIRHQPILANDTQVDRQPLSQVFEPPEWAVRPSGETRLEVSILNKLPGSVCECRSHSFFQPIGDCPGRHSSVDLTTQKAYRVGRSPSMDIQLMHALSSRRHAMLFHHTNGSCYVVDCGSAYGTFVNGTRIPSPGKGGRVVPYKVRRGAIVRFGGPGAPAFILKSFSFSINEIEMGDKTPDEGELVRRNTRVNALGRESSELFLSREDSPLSLPLTVVRKRSFDSLASTETLVLEGSEPCTKRLRCESPPISQDEPLRLVSPEFPALLVVSKTRRVRFSNDPPQLFFAPTVTPEELSDNDSI